MDLWTAQAITQMRRREPNKSKKKSKRYSVKPIEIKSKKEIFGTHIGEWVATSDKIIEVTEETEDAYIGREILYNTDRPLKYGGIILVDKKDVIDMEDEI